MGAWVAEELWKANGNCGIGECSHCQNVARQRESHPILQYSGVSFWLNLTER